MSRGRDRSCRKVRFATWALGAALLCVAATAPDLSAQDAGATQKDPASDQFAAADSIRSGFDRPLARPATDWVDMVAFPLKVIAFPFNLLFVKLPGWVALSVTNLQGVYFPERVRAAYKPLLERAPDAVIGHSIHVYRVDEPWW